MGKPTLLLKFSSLVQTRENRLPQTEFRFPIQLTALPMEVRVGRAPKTNHVALPQNYLAVSVHHLRFDISAGTDGRLFDVYVQDLNTTNGTTIGDKTLQGAGAYLLNGQTQQGRLCHMILGNNAEYPELAVQCTVYLLK